MGGSKNRARRKAKQQAPQQTKQTTKQKTRADTHSAQEREVLTGEGRRARASNPRKRKQQREEEEEEDSSDGSFSSDSGDDDVEMAPSAGSSRREAKQGKKSGGKSGGDGGSRLISDDNRSWLKPKPKGADKYKKGKRAASEVVEDDDRPAAFDAPPRKSALWDDSDVDSEDDGSDDGSEGDGSEDGSEDSEDDDSADAPKVDRGRSSAGSAAVRKTQMWDSDSSSSDDGDDDDEFAGAADLDDVDSSDDSGQEWLEVDDAKGTKGGTGGGAGWSDASSDDSDSDDDDGDDSDDDDEFVTPLERKAKRAQLKAAREAADAKAELDEHMRRQRGAEEEAEEEEGEESDSGIDPDAPKMIKLPSGAGVLESALAPVDITEINMRMQHTIRVLANFAANREGDRSRNDYVSELADLMATYFGYSDFLVRKFLELFGPAECLQFLEANEQSRPVTIRVNTLKSRRRDVQNALSGRGVVLEPIAWSAVGITIQESQVPIGATPEYLGGHYMLQSASSFLPVMALDPQPSGATSTGERILDMCSAPGGKTTHIAQMMQNSGLLFANDVNKDRCKALFANIHRLGVRNAVLSNCDGREFPRVMGGFDRVLLDAPCTGFGVISKDPSVKTQKSQDDLDRMTKEQKELILAAIDSIDHRSKTGAILVYSTCSVSVEENEAVIDYALKKRHVAVVDTGLEFGVPGMTKYLHHRFHPSLSLAKRYYPHAHNLDGFFVCKLRKLGDGDGQKKNRGGSAATSRDGGNGSSSNNNRAAAGKSVVPDVRVGQKKLKVKRKEKRELVARRKDAEKSRARNERKALRKENAKEKETKETKETAKATRETRETAVRGSDKKKMGAKVSFSKKGGEKKNVGGGARKQKR
jgi:25S rRNA (cytosine2870-C5)-methyltransferase